MNKILFITEKSGFVSDGIINHLKIAGFEVSSVAANVKAISGLVKKDVVESGIAAVVGEAVKSSSKSSDSSNDIPHIVILYLQSEDNTLKDVLNYLRALIEEKGISLFVIGTQSELKNVLESFPADYVTETFMRPVNITMLLERLHKENELLGRQAALKKLLLIGSDPAALCSVRKALYTRYNVFIADSDTKASSMLAENRIDTIIIDSRMPREKALRILDMLRSNLKAKDIPIMSITEKDGKISIVEGVPLTIEKAGNYELKASITSNQLLIFLEVQIDLNNSAEFGEAVKKIRAEYPECSLAFDCKNLKYISSAGLRIFLTIRKNEKRPVKLLNVPETINSVLEMTGFSKMFEISKVMRKVSVDGFEVMLQGDEATIYRMTPEHPDNLLKVYREGTPLSKVEQEQKNAKVALLSGIPTIISYDTVICGSSYGLIFEMVRANLVSELMKARPEKFDYYACEMGKLLKLIHSCEPEPVALPRTSAVYEKWAHEADRFISSKEAETFVQMINAIPEGNTIVYGKYHARNVFMQGKNDGPLIIDVSGISCGSPVYDLAVCYMLHVLHPELAERVSGLDSEQSDRLWHVMIRAYFNTEDEKIIAEREEAIRIAALLCSALSASMWPVSDNEAELFADEARQKLIQNYSPHELTEILKSAGF